MQAQRRSGRKRKFSTSQAATDSPKSGSQKIGHESPNNVSQRGDQISSETGTNQSDLRVESSCSAPNKTYTDQIDDKTSEDSTRNPGECVVFHDPESIWLEQVIATHRKEVVQHGNIFELSSHLIQEGLLYHDESESGASNREKMSLVLDSLKEKPNGFTKFLTCIKREMNHLGHAYIASLLEERQFAPDSDLQLSALCKQRIKYNMVKLVKNIDLSSLVHHLHQSFYLSCIRGRTQLLTHEETNKLLLGKETTQNRIRRLFLILETKGPLAHSRFARCMCAADDHKTHQELFEEVFGDLNFPPDLILPSSSSEDEVESDTVCISRKSRKRKSSRSQTVATTQIDFPVKRRQVEPSPQKTIQVPNDITCNEQVDHTPSKANTDPLVESSCPVPSGTNTDQNESKKSTHKIEQLIASHRKEVVQHGNISELSSQLVQKGLLDHDESEYLQSGASNEKKMSCVLNSLKKKPNGFTKFLKCIKRETNHMGHPYIASLLEERQFAPDLELKLSAECKKRFQNNTEKLAEGISLSSLVPHLHQSFYLPCIRGRTQLLTHDETNKLLLGRETTQNKIRRLFFILETKGPLAHSRFARCMYAAEDHKTHQELFEEIFENLNFSPDPILPWLNEEPASQSRKHKNGCLAADEKLLPFVPTNETHLLEMDGVLGGNCYDELMTKFYSLHHNSDGHHQLVTEAEEAMAQDLPLELQALYQIELARSFIFKTQNEKAVELLSAVLKLSDKILGNNGLFIIGRCHHTFADLYRFTNDYDRAKDHSMKAMMALHSVKPGLDTATAHYVNGCILLEECLSNQHSVTLIDIQIIEKAFHSAINDGKDSDIARRVILPQSHCRLAQLYTSSAIGATTNEDNLKKARQSLDACKCQLGFISHISQHFYYLVEADWYRNSRNLSEAVRLAKEACKIAENNNYTLGISSAKAKLNSLI